MPYQLINDRTILALSGADAASFLQGLITTNIDVISDHVALPGALLTPQGKIAFDFLISRPLHDQFYFDIRSDLAPSFEMKLKLYRLRADVVIEKTDMAIATSWDEAALDGNGLADKRFPLDSYVRRHYTDLDCLANIEMGDFTQERLQHGVAESGSEYELADIFPHDIYLDVNGGLDFKKGCYVGQEVVSRMQHRGTARRRLAIVTSQQPLPEQSDLSANNKSIGSYLKAYGQKALAIVRTDRLANAVKEGHHVTVGGLPVTVTFPSIATDHKIITDVDLVS